MSKYRALKWPKMIIAFQLAEESTTKTPTAKLDASVGRRLRSAYTAKLIAPIMESVMVT